MTTTGASSAGTAAATPFSDCAAASTLSEVVLTGFSTEAMSAAAEAGAGRSAASARTEENRTQARHKKAAQTNSLNRLLMRPVPRM